MSTTNITARHDAIPFEVKREKPNAQTLQAFVEYDEMKAHPEKYKRYNSFADFLAEEYDEA